MRLLLDTHTALWLVNEHEKLSLKAKSFLLGDEHDLFVSIASFWEVAIKSSLGKLTDLVGGVSAFAPPALLQYRGQATRQHPFGKWATLRHRLRMIP